MRHFLLMTIIIVGNFTLWSLITILPVHAIIMFCLAVAVGCLMIYLMVRIGKSAEPPAKG